MVGLWQATTGLKSKFYAFLAFFNDNLSRESLALDNKIISFLAGLGIPMACVLHGYVGFIFGGVKANPLWATPLMPVIFLLLMIPITRNRWVEKVSQGRFSTISSAPSAPRTGTAPR